MKKVMLMAIALTVVFSTVQGQSMKEKLEAKLAAKFEKNQN